ncbi:Gliding motility lipoprotein precursor GldH [Flavobacterium indicum GPTSA100-9 = DSM 17447]|jgi:gliding motility-associated lipoprotein GldH|uniref:Gliding motility lipoprotein GldH n=1 Tax=Flavobacterium indicum (strain DSM 17447 / CIP 109464 / GPTSA100-9) TaxID=1094466 RepID=H8XS51_FLAIG|nr:gliding motility lipoprotein GldH [Flavobacterium indicum]CCG54635.1 Gliding motility lipoprotein precursor GldH [Flavobacterium indicum GPTSA100-9 = DSM 17447]
MNNTFIKLALFGLVFVFFACDKAQVFDEYREFDGTWKKNQKASFTFEQKDTISKYNMFLNVRNNNDYPYNNLFVIVSLNEPGGRVLVDTLEYQMTNPDGTLLGKGFSDVKESKLWYKENFSFSKVGKYTVNVEHALRQTGRVTGVQDLEGVTEVGFRIEKTK